MSNKADLILIAGSPPSEQDNYIPCFEKNNNDGQHLSLFLDNLHPYLRGRTDQMQKNPGRLPGHCNQVRQVFLVKFSPLACLYRAALSM
jgi:hypothetical protein